MTQSPFFQRGLYSCRTGESTCTPSTSVFNTQQLFSSLPYCILFFCIRLSLPALPSSAFFLLLQNPFDPSYSKYELDHKTILSTSQSVGL